MAAKTLKNREIDMTTGSLFPKIIAFAVPLIVTSILQLLFNSADMIVVGQFVSNDAVGAVGSTGSLNALMINLAIGLSVGAGVVLAGAYGAHNKQYGSEVLHTAMLISVIIGAVMGGISFFLARDLLVIMGTPEVQLDDAVRYIEIIFLGMPFNMVYNFGASMLRGTGDTKRPLIYLSIAGVVNVIVNVIAVVLLKMGVAGVAIATVISQAISAVLVVITLIKSTGFLHFSLKKLKIHKRALKDILRLGVPSGLQGSLFCITNVLLQTAVNGFGSEVVNGCAIATQIEGYVYAIISSISGTALTVVGQNYGARDYKRIKKTIIISTVFVLIASLAAGWLAILMNKPLIALFTDKSASPEQLERIVSCAYQKMLIIAGTYFLDGIMEVLTYSLRGIGYSVTAMIIVLVGTCAFRIIWIYLIFPAYKTLSFLFMLYPISWLLTLLTAGVVLAIMISRDEKREASGQKNIENA